MQERGFIQYIIIVAVILTVVFLSQQNYARGTADKLLPGISDKIEGYLGKGIDWAKGVAYPKISGEVQKRGTMIKEEVSKEKEKISENIGEKIKDYFSGVVDSVFNKKDDTKTNSEPPQCEPKTELQ